MQRTYYAMSDDVEMWTDTDLNDVVEEFVDLNHGDLKEGSVFEVYKGVGKSGLASNYVPDVPELMAQNAWDNCGECAESWLHGKEAEDLQSAIKNFKCLLAAASDEEPALLVDI